MSNRTVASVLSDATETLKTAEFGLSDLLGNDPHRRMPGLRNLIVFGHAVTNVLQNLRSVVGAQVFDDWYKPFQDEMRQDELLKYFYRVRSEILKEGTLQTGRSVHLRMDGFDTRRLMQNPPSGAKGFFIGDDLNDSGWEVELPDGSIEKYYVSLPDDIQMTARFHFPDPPKTHRGQVVADTSVENLSQLYVDYLRDLLKEAGTHFN